MKMKMKMKNTSPHGRGLQNSDQFYFCVVELKDCSRKRTVLSWTAYFFWCTIFFIFFSSFTLSTYRILFKASFQPRKVFGENIWVAEAPAISILETVIFPNQALLFLKYPPAKPLFTKEAINCIYLNQVRNSSKSVSPESVDEEYRNQQIVRCPLPPRGTIITIAVKKTNNGKYLTPGPTHRWDSLAYDSIVDDRDNSTIVFVKGLNLRSGRVADSSKFKCLYGWDLFNPKLVIWADVVSVAQEIVRCKTPLSILNKFRSDDSMKVSVRLTGLRTIDSIARVKKIKNPPLSHDQKHDICVCTMLRNQAKFLREWIMYHGKIGVERWFIYDNNSDDDIQRVIYSLISSNYNVTRHIWPWIKTQEAGFAHCALRARDSCEWVGFIDVDEFFYLTSSYDSLLIDMVNNQQTTSSSDQVGELRVPCHSFGPSGLVKTPKRGVLAGYTCRLAIPERHKSIVRPEALNTSLINVVHHFHLKSGFRHVNINRSSMVINHYKYQVWEAFKDKFEGRVATYVSDWQQDRNVGSKDRAPGLGTKVVEPVDWSTRFCQVNDTGLKDWVLESFVDLKTSLFPWEEN